MGEAILCLAREEDGQGMTEYALIIVLVSAALFAGLTGMKNALDTVFQGATKALTDVASNVTP